MKLFFKHTVIGTAIASIALMTACGKSQNKSTSAIKQPVLTIKGSDTLVHLVTAWAEAYMEKVPGARISVTGGGSGTGIAAMLNGTTDICMASRPVKKKEVELAKKKNISFEKLIVALDGIAVIVNQGTALSTLSMDQGRQIFNGTLVNWNQVGGADQVILALSRESNSGTYVFFNKRVLMKDDYGSRVKLMPSNATIVQSVSQDKGSIGYVGLAYAQNADVKILGIKKSESSKAVFPNAASVSDGSYPIARPLLLYTNGEAKGLAKAFLDFAISSEGQAIVQQIGYVRRG